MIRVTISSIDGVVPTPSPWIESKTVSVQPSRCRLLSPGIKSLLRGVTVCVVLPRQFTARANARVHSSLFRNRSYRNMGGDSIILAPFYNRSTGSRYSDTCDESACFFHVSEGLGMPHNRVCRVGQGARHLRMLLRPNGLKPEAPQECHLADNTAPTIGSFRGVWVWQLPGACTA